MKRPSVSSLLMAILLLVSFSVRAQEKAAQNADLLREKIEQLEATDLKSKSPTVQDIYKRSLLRLYNQYSEALGQDITDLTAIQRTVGGTSAESLREVNAQIQKLKQERNITAEKIQTLGGDLQVASTTGSSSAHTAANQSALMRPASLTIDATESSATVPTARRESMPLSDSLNAAEAVSARTAAALPSQLPATPPELNVRHIYIGSTLITGKANDCCYGAKVKIKLGTDPEIELDSDGTNGYFSSSVRPLVENEVVQAWQEATPTFSQSLKVNFRVRPERTDLLSGGPFGFLFTGAVFSQQNERFNQSDPFMGFNAGYVSNLHVPELRAEQDGIYTFRREGVDGEKRVRQATDPYTGEYKFYEVDANGEYVKDAKGHKVKAVDVFGGRSFWRKLATTRWELGFQGIFTADARAAKTTTAASTGTGGGTGGTGGTGSTAPATAPNFDFIASRKAFDIEANFWWTWFAANQFSIGPYFAWGASTALSPNELSNEPVTQPARESTGSTTGGTTGSTTPTTTPVVATNSESDNDMKQYQQMGLKAHTYMFNRGLFLRAIVAYGRYEAFKGILGPTHGFFDNPRNRFYGHLTVFPEGLNTSFGKQAVGTPMFGVDINAGHGQDFPRFFIGYAIKIGKINQPAP